MFEVTERALVGRINRALGPWKVLRLCRKDSRGFETLGRYYINGPHGVVDRHIDLETLARKLGVLGYSERLSA